MMSGAGGGGFNRQMFGSGLGGFLGGMFGDSGAPYEAAQQQYQQYGNKAQEAQNPFYNAGTSAIPQFQDWLKGMQDPSGFINHLMGQYQESPWAKYQQQQGVRNGTNAASASGLIGSSPFAQQLQQNSQNISSQDMNQWLNHVLGINTQFGAGQQGLIGTGQNAANNLTNLYGQQGQNMAEAAYGNKSGEDQDFWDMLGGGIKLGGSLFAGGI